MTSRTEGVLKWLPTVLTVLAILAGPAIALYVQGAIHEERIAALSAKVDAHAAEQWHGGSGNRIPQLEAEIASLRATMEERGRSQDERWREIQAALEEIRRDLRELRR